MKFADLIRDLELEPLGVSALLLFLVAFLAIAWRTFSSARDEDYEKASQLPLEETKG